MDTTPTRHPLVLIFVAGWCAFITLFVMYADASQGKMAPSAYQLPLTPVYVVWEALHVVGASAAILGWRGGRQFLQVAAVMYIPLASPLLLGGTGGAVVCLMWMAVCGYVLWRLQADDIIAWFDARSPA